MTTITREQAQAVSDLKAGYTLGHADVAILKDLARIALASLTAEPVLYAAEEALAYANMGELHLTCLSEPMGDAVIPLYAAPPAPVSVPDEMPCGGAENDYQDGYQDGWNAFRAAMLDNCATVESRNHAGCSPKNGLKCAAMLHGSQPVSNREELPVSEIECDICGFKSTDPDGAHYCCEDNSND